MYLLRMRRQYSHKSRRNVWRAVKTGSLQENWCALHCIQIWGQILNGSSNILETVHAQWKIINIGEKQHPMTKVCSSYKNVSFNAFPVTNLRPVIELMQSLRMWRHYCRVWSTLRVRLKVILFLWKSRYFSKRSNADRKSSLKIDVVI